MIAKIISGGLTGADRAALNFAIDRGIEHGGYCPRGRLAEDGKIPEKYNLLETDSEKYIMRTRLNIDFADGILILFSGNISGGTKIAREYTIKKNKPIFYINVLKDIKTEQKNFNKWVKDRQISILNIAGPRESKSQIYTLAKAGLEQLLTPRIVICNEKNILKFL